MFWIGLVIGLFVGGNVGWVVMAVVSMSKPLPAKPNNITSTERHATERHERHA